MKFLLTAINAKYIHSNPAIYSLRGYAGETLRQYIELAEYTVNQPLQNILADIYYRKPDVIGFSCYIWNWSMVQELLAELPKLLPDTDIWLGGPEVTYGALDILNRHPWITGIMMGEGEATFKELLECYVENNVRKAKSSEGDFIRIAGLCLPSGFTDPRETIDMDKLPFLYEDLAPFANKIIYYESARGCPYRCSYCLSSVDKQVRLRDIGTVKKQLQFFLDNKVAQVKFVDRTFNCNHKHATEIWRYIYENDNGVTNFHFEISADILTEDEIRLLRKMRPGLVQLEIGVQSVNVRTIRAVERIMNLEKLERAVKEIHRGGNIHQHLDLIAGLPYEDYESFGKSFDRVYAMKPQQLQLGFLKVLPGAPMHERAREYGIVYTKMPPYEVLYTKWLSYEDVLRLKRIEEMVEIYYNSNQYMRTLPFLERVFDSPFAMYEAMAEFFEEKGGFSNSPARAYRYQQLLRFAEECDGEYSGIYRELLLYDMYLRENLKSRPDFAGKINDADIKDRIRAFYQNEERERHYLQDYADYDWKQMSKMTHLEPFYYPVWSQKDLEGMRDYIRPKTPAAFVLFDYGKRNPLTNEAYAEVMELNCFGREDKGVREC